MLLGGLEVESMTVLGDWRGSAALCGGPLVPLAWCCSTRSLGEITGGAIAHNPKSQTLTDSKTWKRRAWGSDERGCGEGGGGEGGARKRSGIFLLPRLGVFGFLDQHIFGLQVSMDDAVLLTV
jgi:hypothetical protein